MKKILFLFLLSTPFFYVSCSSDDEKLEIEYPAEEEDEYHLKLQGPTMFYEYKLADVTGFDRHPSIETIKPWEKTSVTTSEGLSFKIENFIFSYTLTKENSEAYSHLIYDIMDQGSTVGILKSSAGDDFLAGLKNSKLWIGAFNPSTKEQKQEWMGDTEIDRIYRYHLGYGEYKDYYIDLIKGDIYQFNGRSVAAIYLVSEAAFDYRNFLQGFYLLTDQLIPLDIDVQQKPHEVYPWYGESVLLLHDYSHYYVIKPDGTLYKTKSYNLRPQENTYPISYEQFFQLYLSDTSSKIELLDISTNETIWTTSLPLLNTIYQYEMKYKMVLLNESDNIYEFQVDIIYYNGEQKSVTFKVDKEGNLH